MLKEDMKYLISIAGITFVIAILGAFLLSDAAEAGKTLLFSIYGVIIAFHLGEQFNRKKDVANINSLVKDEISTINSLVKDEISTINNNIDKLILGKGALRSFPNSYDAIEYLIKKLPEAKGILNTRLEQEAEEKPEGKLLDLTNRHDEKIIDAIKGGAYCNLVIGDIKHIPWNPPEYFFQHYNNIEGKEKGPIKIFKLETQGLPLFEFIILDYGAGKKRH